MSSSKNILVLGASGKSGLCTVERALKAGHKVTVYLRNDTTLSEETKRNPNLTILSHSLPEAPEILAPLISQLHGIISLLGPANSKHSGLDISHFYEWLFPHLRSLPPSQRPYLLGMGTQSIYDPHDGWSIFNIVHVILIRIMAPGARAEIMNIKKNFLDDLENHGGDGKENVPLEWTLFRLNLLNDGEQEDGACAGYVRQEGWGANLTRKQLADWLVTQVETPKANRQWVRKLPAIWGKEGGFSIPTV